MGTKKETLSEKIEKITKKIESSELERKHDFEELNNKIEAIKNDTFQSVKQIEKNIKDSNRETTKESQRNTEDQLFFGLVVALAILFLPLPTGISIV